MNILDERLQPCRFCGTEVAVTARRCSKCGGTWPSQKQRSALLVGFGFAAICMLAFGSCLAGPALS